MNWIDGVAIAVVVYCGIKGASRGAVWQLAAVATLVLAAVFTARLAPLVEERLPETIDVQLRPWVAIGLVYLGLSFFVYLLAGRIRAWFEKARFLEFDRHWGAIIGAVKGTLIVITAVALVAITVPKARVDIRRSRSGVVAKFAVEKLLPLMPDWVSEPAKSAFNETEGREEELPFRLE